MSELIVIVILSVLYAIYVMLRKQEQIKFTSRAKPNAWLVSASVTTSWSDGIHGELWLTEDGLVRFRTTILHSLFNPIWPVVGKKAKPGHIEIPKNPSYKGNPIFIQRDEITGYSFNKGILTGRLMLELKDGKSRLFLFLTNDMDYELLTQKLDSWTGV